MSSHVADFNTLNKILTAKLLIQGYQYHKLRKAFSNFIDAATTRMQKPKIFDNFLYRHFKRTRHSPAKVSVQSVEIITDDENSLPKI